MIFEVDKLFECGIEVSKDNIHDALMKNCTAYESGGISFVNFIEKIQESYTEYKNEMRSIMTEQEYSSYVLNEASFSSMASSIGTFIRRAVDVRYRICCSVVLEICIIILQGIDCKGSC